MKDIYFIFGVIGTLCLLAPWLEKEDSFWLSLLFFTLIGVILLKIALTGENPKNIFSYAYVTNFLKIKRDEPIYNKRMAVIVFILCIPSGWLSMSYAIFREDGDILIYISWITFALLLRIGLSLSSMKLKTDMFSEKHKFVLYLRSFESDHNEIFDEFYLKLIFEPFGKFLAIGKPKEILQPFGAGRYYVGNDWKEKVQALIKQASVVVVRTGSTQGLLWEIESLKNIGDPRKTLLYVSVDIHDKKNKRHKEYVDFQKLFKEIVNVQLGFPEKGVKFIWFTSSWEPIYLKSSTNIVKRFFSYHLGWKSVQPVYAYFNLKSSHNRMNFWTVYLPLSVILSSLFIFWLIELFL
jgi:hypothetical protein